MVRKLCSIWIVFYVFFCNIIKVNYFYTVLSYCCISSFLHTRSLRVHWTYAPIESIDCIIFSLFELKLILLISSVKTLCFSLLNFLFIFNISLLFVINYLILHWVVLFSILFFSIHFS